MAVALAALAAPLASQAGTGSTTAIGTLAVIVPGGKLANGIEVPE